MSEKVYTTTLHYFKAGFYGLEWEKGSDEPKVAKRYFSAQTEKDLPKAALQVSGFYPARMVEKSEHDLKLAIPVSAFRAMSEQLEHPKAGYICRSECSTRCTVNAFSVNDRKLVTLENVIVDGMFTEPERFCTALDKAIGKNYIRCEYKVVQEVRVLWGVSIAKLVEYSKQHPESVCKA